ncbi:MAG TPA: C39 family peptidase [Nitrosomonas sp.]|nr:C39 family peptidase [Nitrosomonas sp.]
MSEQVEKLHPAVYESQRDNIFDGSVTCAVTTLSMLIQSHGMTTGETRQPKHLEDDILKDLRARYPKDHKDLREDFNFLARYTKEKYSIELKYAAFNKNDWIAKILNSDAPFMTSTSNGLTSFGHIVLSRGIKGNDAGVMLYFNDPFGKFPYKTSESGEGVKYPAALFPFDDGKWNQKKYHTLSYA